MRAGMMIGIVLLMLVGLLPAQPPPATPPPQPINLSETYRQQVGWQKLVNRLKASNQTVPTGQGVWVMHVEPSSSTDPKKPAIRPEMKEVFDAIPEGFVMNCAVNPEEKDAVKGNTHAANVARHLYGRYAIATGIRKVDMLEPGAQFVAKLLGFPKDPVVVSKELPKISSHSYVLAESNPALVRRLDEFIMANDHIAVVAVGVNNPTAPVSPIWGTSYNAIVVGLSSGKAAKGVIKDDDDGGGRVKPDLVVPLHETSIATPAVASAIAVLIDAAKGDTVAAKPTVMKAILMASAEKTFVCEEMIGTWKNSETQPLNPIVGAGQLDIDDAHKIVAAGRVTLESKKDGGLEGWAYESISGESNASKMHIIDIPDEQETMTISAVLTWNRQFKEGKPIVPDLNLTFGLLDGNDAFENVRQRSVSNVDNVELLWNDNHLPPGRYGMRVSNMNGQDTDYALAWQITTRPKPKLFRAPPTKPDQSKISRSGQVAVFCSLVAVVISLITVFRKRLRN